MSTTVIRDRFLAYFAEADAEEISALYNVLKPIFAKNGVAWWKDKNFLKEVERRRNEILSGKVVAVSWNKVRKEYI